MNYLCEEDMSYEFIISARNGGVECDTHKFQVHFNPVFTMKALISLASILWTVFKWRLHDPRSLNSLLQIEQLNGFKSV